MDYCFVLVLILVLLTIITLVGHFLWVMTAAVFGALFKFDDSATSSKPLASADRGYVRGGDRNDIECILCGRLFVRRHRNCPQCGLDCKQEEAVELRDLDTTARQLGQLARLDETQREVIESTLRTVDRRRHELVRRLEQMTGFAKDAKPQPSQPAVLEPTPPPKTIPAEQPIAELAELNTILSSNPDVRQLSPEQRTRALALYRTQPATAWARLGPAQLLPLARLVRMAGLGSRALELYGLLLLHYPQYWQACEAVVEAATLAKELGQNAEKLALINKAASLPLTAEQRRIMEELETPTAAKLAEEEEIPTVLPVQRPQPATSTSVPAVEPQIDILPSVPKAPRRSIGEMLAAFMEERNILWGELVGGLLIVGCSIALVISLREKLEEIQYFPFLVVGSVAAALLGAGRYTLSHWKLEATSRGLLVIGTLLVPLSFMVLAGVASGREGGLLEAAMEVGAIAFFTWLVRGATAVLLRQPIGPVAPWPDWLTTLAIMGASASQLLVPHIKENDFARDWLGLVGYVPAALLILTQGITWQSVYRRDGVSARQAGGLFLALALAVYATIVAFSFVLYRADNIGQALEYLAVPVALAGLPLLLGGTITSAKLKADESQGETIGLPLGVAGVIATMLALGGTLVLLMALVAAWPHPVRLTAIAAVNAVVLAFVAQRFRLTPAYVPAQICLVVAVLTGYHYLVRNLDVEHGYRGVALLKAWVAPSSGVLLCILAGVLAAAAEWQTRRGRANDARFQAIASGALAFLSLVLALVHFWDSPGRAAAVFAAVAAGGWSVNLRWRQQWLTAAAAFVAFGAAFFTIYWFDSTLPIPQIIVWALLADAAIALAMATFVERFGMDSANQSGKGLQEGLIAPLHWAALTASIIGTLGVFQAVSWNWLFGGCIAVVGFGIVWLVLAWRLRRPELFAAFQGALVVAVLFGVVRILVEQPWFTQDNAGLFEHIWSWQAYGVGLSGLSLAWMVARFALRRSDRIWALVEPGWPALDRVLLGSMVVLALAVTAIASVPGIAEELTAHASGALGLTAGSVLNVCGPLGWGWLALLAMALVLALWQGRHANVGPGLTVTALSAAVLAATAFDTQIAVASAARWALAQWFVGCSALLWWRGSVTRLATALKVPLENGKVSIPGLRIILCVGAIFPVLLLTADVAVIGFARLHPSGPLVGSFFDDIGVVANNLTPLVLLCAGLAGHGVRERSAGYAFSGGLIALLTAVGGHALGIVTGGGVIGSAEAIQLGQLATGVMSLWLLGWLGVRRGLGIHPAPTHLLPCRVMLAVQEGLVWATYLLWFVPALLLLSFAWPFVAPVLVAGAVITMETASWLGWLVVGLAITAGVAYRVDAASRVPTWFLGMASILIGGLAACTVTTYAPDWDQRALMLIAAGLSLLFVPTLVRWSVVSPGKWLATSRDSVLDSDSAIELLLVCGVGGFAVLLAVQRAINISDHRWAALAVAIVAAAMMTAAWLRFGEHWLFVGGLLAMLATSLLVCDFYLHDPTAPWRLVLIQANLATAGVVGCCWMLWLKQISNSAETGLGDHPWLCVQQTLAFGGNACLLFAGFVSLISQHVEKDAQLVLTLGGFTGWLALVPAVVGGVWLLWRLAPDHAIHALASAGLMTGVLAACSVSHGDNGQHWFGHHTVSGSWLIVATGLLVAGWKASANGQVSSWRMCLVLKTPVIAWVTGIGAVLASLAFGSGWADPSRPYWPSALALGVSVLMGALALWTRKEAFVFGSGLLFNVVGFLLWVSWAEHFDFFANMDYTNPAYRGLLIQIVCFAVASLVWSGVQLSRQRLYKLPALTGAVPRFRHLAAWVALVGLILLVGITLVGDAVAFAFITRFHDPVVWLAVAGILAATTATLWDDQQEPLACPMEQLYFLGLVAVGIVLQHSEFRHELFLWAGTLAIGPYILLTALACTLGLRNPTMGQEIGMSRRLDSWPLGWFVICQLLLAAGVMLVSVWICLTFGDTARRLFVFLAVACLPAAAWVVTPHWSHLVSAWKAWSDERIPRITTLLLAVFACAWLHCAIVDPSDVAPWLHRCVLLMAGVTWMCAIYGIVLPRFLPAGNTWSAVARRLAGPLGCLACGFLALVMLQEAFLWDREAGKTPMALPAVVVVAAALTVLIGGALTFALSPTRDVLKLSERGRTIYVYAAEILIVLLLVHLRYTVPEMFPRVGRFWPFVIVAVAFAGVGLSELSQRWGLRVLADPLQRTAMLLPLLPLAAFLIHPLKDMRDAASDAVSGATTWTRFIDNLPDDYRQHAAIWFLMGLLYLIVALTRRSSNLALVAAIIANFGIWVLLGHQGDLAFRFHPQLWLIPIGVIILFAESLNRDRLLPSQSQAIRYCGILLIYISSTADMFIEGLGGEPWYPIALAVLSVAGVLVGILLRVRAFLFLGMTFLFLVVFSQIWHAAVDRAQTWVWWVSGIVLGVAILTMFALFEKRRNDVLKMIDEIKRWR